MELPNPIFPRLQTTLMLLAICLGLNFLTAQRHAITDPRLEQLLIDQGIDTNGTTGDILEEDALKVRTLEIRDAHIRSLKGLEAFTNLANLVVEGDSIHTNIDFRFAKKLTLLDLRGVHLKKLNLQKNTLLEVLYLKDCRQINKLAVDQNPNLISITLINLPVTKVDLSQNPKLKIIHIKNNQKLASVDLANGNNKNIRNRIGVDVDLSNNEQLQAVMVDDALRAYQKEAPYSEQEWLVDTRALFKDKLATNNSAQIVRNVIE